MSTRFRWFFVIALVHGLLLGILFKGVWSGTSTFVAAGDSIDQSFMWLAKVFAAARHGEVALWDFNIMSGVSFAGELQTSPFYPVAWLAAWMLPPGTLQAFDTFLILHFGIAALGMVALVLHLGLSPAAALVSSAIFAYGTSFSLRVAGQPNLFASLAWLPWVAFFFVAAIRPGRLLSSTAAACGAGAAIALTLLAGHAHSTVLALIVAACLLPTVFDVKSGPNWKSGMAATARSVLGIASIAGVVALLLALPQIIATKEYLELAYKWYGASYTTYPHIVPIENFINQSVGFRDLITVFNGDQVRAEDGGTFFFTKTGLMIALISIIYIKHIIKSNYYYLFLSIMVMFIFSITFSFAFVKPFSYAYMQFPVVNIIRSPPRALFVFGFAAALLAGVGVDIIRRLAQSVLPEKFAWGSNIPVVFVMILLFAEFLNFAPRRVIIDVHEQQNVIQQALENPLADKIEALSSAHGNMYRFYAPRDQIAPNIGNLRSVLSAHGYRSSRTVAYHDFFDFNPRSPRMDALGVRWWVSDKPIEGLTLLARAGDAFLYERPSALPVLWQALDGGARSALPISNATWRENDVTFTFSSPQSGRFVFGQTAYPGWRALIDGRPARVSLHEGLQSTITGRPVTTVSFIYDPPWWRPTAIISVVTAFAVFAYMLLALLRRRAVS